MHIILTRIQQIVIINTKQKFLNFSNSSKFVNIIDIDNIDEITINDNEQRFVVIRTINDIEYFDSTYENEKNNSIVNVDQYIYYRNVFIFVDRLKNLKKKICRRARARARRFLFTKQNFDNILLKSTL